MSSVRSTFGLLIGLAGAMAASFAASPGITPSEYLEQARAASVRSFSDVEDVICQEHVDRYRTSRTGTLELMDSIEAQVAVEHGIEQYSAIRQDGKDRASFDEIGAVWSDSEYATFVNDARQALNRSSMSRSALTTLNGGPAIVISFETAPTASNWDFLVGGRDYKLGFRGEIWISQETGQLLRCRRVADRIEHTSGVRSIDWNVDFGVIKVAGKTVSVPTSATYDVYYTRRDGSAHNAIVFSNYHRFVAKASIRFELDPTRAR